MGTAEFCRLSRSEPLLLHLSRSHRPLFSRPALLNRQHSPLPQVSIFPGVGRTQSGVRVGSVVGLRAWGLPLLPSSQSLRHCPS